MGGKPKNLWRNSRQVHDKWVIEAALAAEKILDVYVAVTNQTPNNQGGLQSPSQVVKTDGNGYHLDFSKLS